MAMDKKKIPVVLKKYQWPLLGLFLGLLILFPFMASGMSLRVGSTILIYCVLVMGNMIITGFTGMLNMGMAAFYGVGAYASALLSVDMQLPFWACFLLAGIVSAACGLLIAIPCLRVETDFLSLITIAFANVFTAILNNWTSLTRGPMGIPAIPPAELFGLKFNTPIRSFYLMLSVVILTYLILNNLIKSRVGRALQATRDNEIGARSVGINIKRQKVLAFGIGTFFAGLAGSLMAHYIGFVGPSNFTFDESLLIMQMCIIGGLGSMPGAIIGATFFVIMPEIIRPLAQYRIGVGGFIMILCMLFRPQGIMGSRAFAGKGGFQEKIRAYLRRSQCEKGGNACPKA